MLHPDDVSELLQELENEKRCCNVLKDELKRVTQELLAVQAERDKLLAELKNAKPNRDGKKTRRASG